eukprot:jgi/Tetstr1/441381/TSEL_029630.t1
MEPAPGSQATLWDEGERQRRVEGELRRLEGEVAACRAERDVLGSQLESARQQLAGERAAREAAERQVIALQSELHEANTALLAAAATPPDSGAVRGGGMPPVPGPVPEGASPATDRPPAGAAAMAVGATSNDQQPKRAKPTLRVTKKQRQGKAGRQFDFSRYAQRFVALEVVYIGWDFWGFASVADSEETIEGHLFRALEKTCLVPTPWDRAALKYSRCGRTDRGVSALGQVVALLLRSAAPADAGPGAVPAERELDYPAMLNKVLPPTIRVTAWAPVAPSFSARFSALWREYKYLILPKEGCDLAAMRQAASYFEGEHDFRHFCKATPPPHFAPLNGLCPRRASNESAIPYCQLAIDAANVSNFVRSISFFEVNAVEGCRWGGRQLFELHLRGSAFLWHQVRCMAAVLLLVGEGREAPEVVRRYLDVTAEPLKPQYSMASEEPLLLYACGYDALELRRSEFVSSANRDAVAAMLDRALLRAGLLWTVLDSMRRHCPGGGEAPRQSRHIPLDRRPKEPSVEEKLAKYGRVPVALRDLRAAAAVGEEEEAEEEEGGATARRTRAASRAHA